MNRVLTIFLAIVIGRLGYGQSIQTLSLVKDYRAGRVSTWRANSALSGQEVVVDFLNTAPYPALKVLRPVASDWSSYDAFLIDIENTNLVPILFYVRLDNSLTANGVVDCRTGWAYIEPGQKKTFAFPLRIDPAQFGMKALPGLFGSTWLSMNNSVVNISNIVRYQVSLVNPQSPYRLILKNPRVVRMNTDLAGICDRWGQYVDANWSGKVHSDAEFAEYHADEDVELMMNPEVAHRDEKGGFNAELNFTGEGRFRTKKYLNNWWLVTPEGWPFLSFGMNNAANSSPTIITGREYMFEWLPSLGDPLFQFFGKISDHIQGTTLDGDTYSFLKANLYRKYGPSYESENADQTLDRLKSWGFNTLGNWSLESLWSRQRVPYTVGVELPVNHMTFSVDPKRVSMSDPYDETFRLDVREGIQGINPVAIGDPWCVGWFIDNEPTLVGGVEESGRYGIAYGVLKQSIFSSPAKVVFVTDLQAKYVFIEGLNAAWGTSFPSWETLALPLTLPDQDGTAARKQDFQEFCLKLQTEYLMIMDEELHAADDRALFLGCRYFRFSADTLAASAQYCDVISFNIYAAALGANWMNYSLINKPFMVSEFHFGALDRGMFHPGLVAAANQTQRADFLRSYVRSIADNPQFVGCHWHEYYDEPLTGRVNNGENYNIGFVNAADLPYKEMRAAARQVLEEAYPRRWARN